MASIGQRPAARDQRSLERGLRPPYLFPEDVRAGRSRPCFATGAEPPSPGARRLHRKRSVARADHARRWITLRNNSPNGWPTNLERENKRALAHPARRLHRAAPQPGLPHRARLVSGQSAARGTAAGLARNAGRHRSRPQRLEHDPAPSRLRPDAAIRAADLASLERARNSSSRSPSGPAFTRSFTGGCLQLL